MRIGQIFQVSLATKCHILFGTAVIVIIIAALLVPWLFMDKLVNELNINQAKQSAISVQSAYQLESVDWEWVQKDLNETWLSFADELGLAERIPRLIYVGGCSAEPDPEWGDFETLAIEQLCQRPRNVEAHRIDSVPEYGRITRYALAIRSHDSDRPYGRLLGIIVVTLAGQELWSYATLYQLVMIGAALVAGLLAIVVFYLITQYLILSPVRELEAVSRRIVSGETNLRSEIRTGDEYEELGEAFNEMLAHLNESQLELRKMNRSLDAKLAELAESNVALFEANRLKGEFLANVSHELRTPLTSIIGFAELLRDASEVPEKANPEKIQRFCNNILTSGRNLLDLINNLLDLTKIEAGKMKLHRTRFPIADICEAVVDFTRPLVDKKNLQVELTLPTESPMMHSDAGKIQQIVYNLLSNAIKFTPSGGRISVSVKSAGPDKIALSVKDTGPGIAREAQDKIFEKFRQLDGSVTREYGGSGLGLAISQELARMLGGDLTLQSDVGQGANFTITLPLESPEESEVPLIQL